MRFYITVDYKFTVIDIEETVRKPRVFKHI